MRRRRSRDSATSATRWATSAKWRSSSSSNLRCRPAKLASGLAQHAGDLVLREREDARHQQAGARAGVRGDLLAGQVGFGDDPARVVQRGDGRFA